MDRRKSLELIAGFGPPLLLLSKPAANSNLDTSAWLNSFRVRWKNSRTYCFEVFDAMPASDFNYEPHPEMMSFGKLFAHIGSGLHGYAEVLIDSVSNGEPRSINKTDLFDYLSSAFIHFNQALDEIELDDLYEIKHAKSDLEPWKAFSIFDIITLGYNHTIHHIAQATVYIRLKNIAPPRYRF